MREAVGCVARPHQAEQDVAHDLLLVHGAPGHVLALAVHDRLVLVRRLPPHPRVQECPHGGAVPRCVLRVHETGVDFRSPPNVVLHEQVDISKLALELEVRVPGDVHVRVHPQRVDSVRQEPPNEVVARRQLHLDPVLAGLEEGIFGVVLHHVALPGARVQSARRRHVDEGGALRLVVHDHDPVPEALVQHIQHRVDGHAREVEVGIEADDLVLKGALVEHVRHSTGLGQIPHPSGDSVQAAVRRVVRCGWRGSLPAFMLRGCRGCRGGGGERRHRG
mmetsp:Transcript_45743/g.87443  ORF Transcript_45743/g.87443 Transcript_45743/m.87443 type:complete len:277 (+) Transcript_45743:1168-1998(+)